MLNRDLVSLVTTVHMVFARSEIFPRKARDLGVGSEQFHASVNGLSGAGCELLPNTHIFAPKLRKF